MDDRVYLVRVEEYVMKLTAENVGRRKDPAHPLPFSTRLGAGIVAFTLAAVGLFLVPTVAEAAESVYRVTDASDDRYDPKPGTLRYITQEIYADSDVGGDVKDYVIEIPEDISLIEMEGDLMVMVQEGARSLAFRGSGADHSLIDMDDNEVHFYAEQAIDSIEVSAVGFTDAHGVVATFEHGGVLTMNEIRTSDIGQVVVSRATSATVNSSIFEGAWWQVYTYEESEFVVHDSQFIDSSMLLELPGGNAAIYDSRFVRDYGDPVMKVTGTAGNPREVQSFVFDGNTVSGSVESGISLSRVVENRITDSVFEDNLGKSGISVLPTNVPGASLVVADVTFTGNSYDEAPIMVEGFMNAATLVNSSFSGNRGGLSGVLYFAPGFDGQAATPVEGLLEPGSLRVADNTFQDNVSEYESTVTIENWLQQADVDSSVERNVFVDNTSLHGMSDLYISHVGEGDEESRGTLLLRDNTFAGSTSAPGRGQPVSLGSVHGARVDVWNNTFDVEADGEPAIHIGELRSGGGLDIAFATFSGGGVLLEDYDALDRSHVKLQSTVFNTSSDPMVVMCDCDVPLTVTDVVSVASSERVPEAELHTSQEIMLLPLADNGGSTPTMRPDVNSVLLGKSQAAPAVSHDQRGVPRPIGEPSDVGAVQRVTGVVELSTDVTVTEGDNVEIPVVRTGSVGFGFDVDTEVDLVAADGTAKTGVDFTGRGGVVTFASESAALDPAQQEGTLTIPTLARSGVQGDRSFTVTIASTTNSADIGESRQVTVTITDSGSDAGSDSGSDANANVDAGASANSASNANAAAGASGGSDVAANGKKPDGDLARTGAEDSNASLAIGALLLLVGAATVLVTRARWLKPKRQ